MGNIIELGQEMGRSGKIQKFYVFDKMIIIMIMKA